ncbi:MAG: ArsR/SmtB family transcription factor [Gemmataceae bacterium]
MARGTSQEDITLNPQIAAKPRGFKPPPRTPGTIKIPQRTLKSMKQVFKLLADELRLKILLVLSEEGEMHVSALCELLGQTQPAVSHHLTLLRMSDLVGFRRDGKYNYYRLESRFVRDLLKLFSGQNENGHSVDELALPMAWQS